VTRRLLADVAWVLFHGLGAVACYAAGFWVPYWVAFLAVELVGLAVDFPMTDSVRGVLAADAEEGRVARHVLVGSWRAWLVATWWLYAPLPETLRGLVGLGFLVWIVPHFWDSLPRASRRSL